MIKRFFLSVCLSSSFSWPSSFLNPQPPSCLPIFITLLFPLNIIFISDCHGTGEMRLLIKFGSLNAQRFAWLKCMRCVLNAEDERRGSAVIVWLNLSQDSITASANTDGVVCSTPPQQATVEATCVWKCPGPLRKLVILRERCLNVGGFHSNDIYFECHPIMKILSLFIHTHVLINPYKEQ